MISSKSFLNSSIVLCRLTGAGLAGSAVAGATGSAVAGQVAAGTTAGLLTGKTVEQSLAQSVGNIKLDSLIPDSGVTVANEAQVTAGQQDLNPSLLGKKRQDYQ